MINPDDHLLVLPPNYRIGYRFFLIPVQVAGKRRWFESVRVIQRLNRDNFFGEKWVDIGFYDEVFPTLQKQPLHDRDWGAADP